MNYRHIYHAGNFADIFKHLILSRIIEYFKRKENPFRVIDTHAGIGIYNLYSTEAQKTNEWQDGLGAFINQTFDSYAEELIAPWKKVLFDINVNNENLKYYPGSPILTRKLLRKQDRLTAMELHEEDYQTLKSHFISDFQAKIIHLDGWLALKSQLPCKEKRAIILIDPPYEETNEFDKLYQGVIQAYKRAANATYILWYPIKYFNQIEDFVNKIKALNINKILRTEIHIRDFDTTITLKDKKKFSMPGCGILVINPPYILENDLMILKPYLLKSLAQDNTAKILINQLS